VVYTQLNVLPIFRILRKVMYQPKKKINSRRILNRLDEKGLAIWYMDDGHINLAFNPNGNLKSFFVKIATCQSKEDNQIIIDYFNERWNISFYQFSEGKGTYSIACGTKNAKKFLEIVKPYILEIPSMWYKLRNKMTKDEFNSSLVGNGNIAEIPKYDLVV